MVEDEIEVGKHIKVFGFKLNYRPVDKKYFNLAVMLKY